MFKHIRSNLLIIAPLLLLVVGLFFTVVLSQQSQEMRSKAAGSDYLIFTKPLFDFVLPDAVPATGEITSTIKLSVSPDEYEPATFVVRATQKDLAGVTVTAEDLKKGALTIPKQHIDIRVVKVWKQGGLNKTIDFPAGILVPELLLYNDADRLTGGLKPDGTYTPPTISTTLQTAIPKDTSKQFWVTVYIPPGTPAGKYISSLTISSTNTAPQQITLEATVLPIALKQPKQIYGLYYRDELNELFNIDLVRKDLTDIRTHGFGAMVFMKYDDVQSFRQVLSSAKTLGFTGPIISGLRINNNATSAGLLREFGYEPYIYGIDEPNENEQLMLHIRKSYKIHQAGGKVMVAIYKKTSDALDNPADPAYDLINPQTGHSFRSDGITNEKLDMASYQAGALQHDNKGVSQDLWDYIEGLRTGTTPKLAKQEVYYWQIWQEKPTLNRMMAGFFLWTSKLDGIYPYIYQGRIEESGDPFNDFDTTGDKNHREAMTTYPSAQGPIPTTKWEALREGYDDVRYLTTFYDLLPSLRAKNSQLATSLAQEIKTEIAKYNDPKDYAILSGTDFGRTRQLVIRNILAAQNELGPTPTPTPTPTGSATPTSTPTPTPTPTPATCWEVMTYNGLNTDQWKKDLGLRYARAACSSAPDKCLNHFLNPDTGVYKKYDKLFLSPGKNAPKAEEYALQYSQLSLNYPKLHEIGFDDFYLLWKRPENEDGLGFNQTKLKKIIDNTKRRNPNLKFGLTLYENQLSLPGLEDASFSANLRKKIDYVHLYLHYRKNSPDYTRYVEITKQKFPQAKIIAGSYAYDRIDYLPCSQSDPGKTKCTKEEELRYYNVSLEIQANLLKNCIVEAIEFYPAVFGYETTWGGWENTNVCLPERKADCIQNTKTMRTSALRILNATKPSPTPTPTPSPSPIPGDITDDHDTPGDEVNIYDYNVLVADFGKTGNPGWIPADINKNGKVDIFDYNILVGNYEK